ncbi:MAG: hypothetical protein NC124_19555 [Clostridium sp.]|nr:hypothetical protein [Clostridium sp.]
MDDDEIEVFLKREKIAPVSTFYPAVKNMETSFQMASGVIVADKYKRGVTVELLCKSSKKLKRESFKFTLFVKTDGVKERIYQLDTASYGIGAKGEHDWPHEHIGSKRVVFNDNFPKDFHSALTRFCEQTSILFEEDIISPFEVSLK